MCSQQNLSHALIFVFGNLRARNRVAHFQPHKVRGPSDMDTAYDRHGLR